MANEATSTLELQIDVKEAVTSIVEVQDVLDGLKKMAGSMGGTIAKAFIPMQNRLTKVREGAELVKKTLMDMTAKVTQAQETAEGTFDIGAIFSGIKDGYKSATQVVDTFTKVEKYSGMFQTIIEELATAPNILNLFNSMFPKTMGMFDTIKSAFSGMSLGWGAAIAGIITLIVLLVQNWDTVSAKVQEVWSFVEGVFANFDTFLQDIFAKDFTEQFGAFGSVLNAFFANVENIWNAVKSIFGGIVDFVKNVFAGDWGAAWDSILGVFKGVWDLLVSIVKVPINGIIGLINMLIASVYSGIADVINGIGSVVAGIGNMLGLDLGFSIPTTPPQIPYLAKGAVLPANRPFLAMVGDQRHGTNIEAPLATIQEAVALVMQDQTAAILSGVQASVGIQREILEAVLGIQIGDDVIGRRGFCVLGFDRGHGNVCCLRGGNGNTQCFGDPLAGVLWVEVSGRCGFAFGARRQMAQADEKQSAGKKYLQWKGGKAIMKKKERG